MDTRVGDRAEQDLEDSAQVFRTLLAEDQSNLRPEEHTGKHRPLAEAEPKLYRAARDSAYRDIWLSAMHQEC